MISAVMTRSFSAPDICRKEILRYAGCKEADPPILSLLEECLAELKDKLSYRVCYCLLPVSVAGENCDFGAFSLSSRALADRLVFSDRVAIFAATVGVTPDRLVAKYGSLSPTKSLLFQAIGAERIEALCDLFCNELEKEERAQLSPRFSPGYGDLPLSAQKEIFSVLEPSRHIGLSLNDSLIMTPTKSVTAFIGLGKTKVETENKCISCGKQDCAYRGKI